jgi:integrase/recombinase XerD
MDIDTFINGYEAAPLTKKAYRQSLETFQRFLGRVEPTEEKVEEFMHKLQKEGISSATINRHLSAIRTYFLWMKKKAPKEKRADFDLIVRGPKMQRKLPPLRTDENVKSIIAVAKTSFERALIMVLYDGALRIAELMNMQVHDVDFDGGYVKITRKGGEEARIPVSGETLKALKKYIGKRKGQIFTQPYWRLNYEINKIANRAGIRKLTPHQLRHARACDLRLHDVALENIQELLGHKNIQTTLIYARMMPTGLKKKIPSAF